MLWCGTFVSCTDLESPSRHSWEGEEQRGVVEIERTIRAWDNKEALIRWHGLCESVCVCTRMHTHALIEGIPWYVSCLLSRQGEECSDAQV